MNDNLQNIEKRAEILRSMPELIKDSEMRKGFSDYMDRAEKDMKDIFSSRENVVALMEVMKRDDWRQMRAYLTVVKDRNTLRLVRQPISTIRSENRVCFSCEKSSRFISLYIGHIKI